MKYSFACFLLKYSRQDGDKGLAMHRLTRVINHVSQFGVTGLVA